MSSPEQLALIATAVLCGGLLGILIGWWLAAARKEREFHRREVDAAQRHSAALANAEQERERRSAAEARLSQAESALRQLDRELAVTRQRAEEAARTALEQKRFLDTSQEQLEKSFRALAAEALKGSSEQFLALAEQRLATQRSRAAADLEERKQAIETLLSPLRDTLKRLDSKTTDMERSRVEAYSRIDEQIELLSRATSNLQEKTTSLATALRGSQTRGRWGELALRNIAELAGMTAHCDFHEQMTLDDGRRPDMTVRLPGGRMIPVDAKAPLTAYLEANDATDERTRQEALDRHAKALRQHVRQLAARDYATGVEGDVDIVVMFLPGDPFLSAAFAQDPELQVEALRSKVLIATPTTLVALLRTVAIYWQQQSTAENAEAIAATARELYDRAAKFGEDLVGVGRGLKTALDAYNRAVGSFDRRLRPMAKRLEELKVTEQSKRQLTAPNLIDDPPRELPGVDDDSLKDDDVA